MASDDKDKKARLAEALRANLRRRKAQARAVVQDAHDTEAREPGAPSGKPD